MGLLDGKVALVLGVANRFSIAWGIAQALHREGARLVLNYQGERVERPVRQLAETLENTLVYPCDVTIDEQIDALFAAVKEEAGGLDTLVHCLAYAPTDALNGQFVDTSRDAFRMSLDISTYSLVAVTKRAVPLFEERGGGTVTALSYLGGERVIPHYNLMGVAKAALEMSVRYLAADLGPQNIRVNTISAGPISTASGRAIGGFTELLSQVANVVPLRHKTTTDEVGDTAVYLASDLSRGVTGERIHVDSGFHILGVAAES